MNCLRDASPYASIHALYVSTGMQLSAGFRHGTHTISSSPPWELLFAELAQAACELAAPGAIKPLLHLQRTLQQCMHYACNNFRVCAVDVCVHKHACISMPAYTMYEQARVYNYFLTCMRCMHIGFASVFHTFLVGSRRFIPGADWP